MRIGGFLALPAQKKAFIVFLTAFVAFAAMFACVHFLADEAFAQNVGSSSSSKNAKAAASSKKKTGLVWKDDGLYYNEKGKMVKSDWRKVSRKKYYFGKNGKAYWGIRKIAGICYLFNDNGTLYRSNKTKMIERNNHTYCVNKSGQVLTHWQLYKNKLYHFSSWGKMDVDKTVDHVKLGEDGVSDNSKAAQAKILAVKIINKVARSYDSRQKKLKAAWNYLVSKSNFRYRSIYPDQSKKNWQYYTSWYMLKNRMGNCFSFACAFAQIAQVIGYDPVLVLGRIHGSRDSARDGFTRHSWVKINGKCYDPELKFASGYHIYGTSHYPMSTRNVKLKKF